MVIKKSRTKIEQAVLTQDVDTSILQVKNDNKSKIKDTLNDVSDLDTIEFYLGDEIYAEEIKQKLVGKDCSWFRNAKIIDLDQKLNETSSRHDLEYIDLAFDMLVKNPDSPIILISFRPINSRRFDWKRNKLNLLLSKPQVKFISNPFDLSTLPTLFESKKNPSETNEDIYNTIQFYESSSRWPYLKKFFASLDLKKLNLKNTMIVDLRPENNSRNDMSGLKIAYETLQKYPDSKIILCSLIPIDIFKEVLHKFDTEKYLIELLNWKNVKIIQSSWWNSMTEEEVLKQFDGMYLDSEASQASDWLYEFKRLSLIESEVAFHSVLQWEITLFLHDYGHLIRDWSVKDIPLEKYRKMSYVDILEYCFTQPLENKSERRIAFEDKLIYLLWLQHPSYKNVSRARNLGGILATYKYIQAQEVPEWTRYEWVFVDRDGTLYDNIKKEFNQNVIDLISQYQKDGKKITIFTLGNLEEKQALLDNIWLDFKVESKIDYKGAMLEILLEDESEEKVYANAKLKAETYIKI